MTFITINTDASFRHGCGGMAAWIVYNTPEKQTRSLVWNEPCENSYQAERKALCGALEHIYHHNFPGEIVVVNCDCQQLVQVVIERKDSYINTLIEQLAKPLRIKKVKAHTRGHDPRHWVNNWCDEQSRQARIKLEKVLKISV